MISRKRSTLSVLTVVLLAVLSTLGNCWAGQWYPGIIHAHSILSDGEKTPVQLAAMIQSELKRYRKDGKGFMILTDHYDMVSKNGAEAFFVYPTAVRNTSVADRFVAIPGFELGSKWHPEANTEASAHILAIGRLPEDFAAFDSCYDRNPGLGTPLIERFDYQQGVIDQILALGMLPVAAHPSQLVIGGTSTIRADHRFNMHANYNGLRGVEMFNVLGPGQVEESFQFYLRLLSEGFSLFVTSGCDYHGAVGGIPELALGALERITWVYADSLTEDGIIQAITEGKTYAARGGARLDPSYTSQYPRSQVINVDQLFVKVVVRLRAEHVQIIIYRDGREVFCQEQTKNPSSEESYSLGDLDSTIGRGWLDPNDSASGVRTYVIKVIATKNGIEQTVLVTSPICLRLRPKGQSAAFFDAIKAGDAAKVAGLLREDPSLANERDRRWILDSEAMRYHNYEPLALSMACALNSPEVVRALLDAGALPDKCLEVGEPGPFMNVACTGNIPIAQLLFQYGARINICTDGNTPLVWAIVSKQAALSKWLIEHGADINHPGDSGRTPLKIARQAGLQEIVSMLVARGAKE